MCPVKGFLRFIRRQDVNPRSSGSDLCRVTVSLVGRPGGLPVYRATAKLLGRRRCLCQNLIINPPYCEKWVSPALLFLRQRSWSGAPSFPRGGCVAVALGAAPAFSGGACFSPFLLGLLCSLHHASKSGLEVEAPSQPIRCHHRGGRTVWSLPALRGRGRAECSLSPTCPQLTSTGTCYFHSVFPDVGSGKC